MHFTGNIKCASIVSVANLKISSSAWQQAPASTAHVNFTRSLLSAHTVYTFSASQASTFTECGCRRRVGSCGVHELYSSKTAQIKSKRMTTSATSERQYFTLTYDYVPDVLEKRGPYRPDHIALAQAQEAEGKLLLGGAWGDPVDGALLIWHVHSADEVQQFVETDPYVKNGLVTKFDIRPVAAVVGSWVTAAKN